TSKTPSYTKSVSWQHHQLFVVSFLIYNIFQELQLSSKLAVHDVLTNIYNRRYFFNSVESLLSRPVVKDFCVMLVDINQFKRINAQWGHRVGDKVLVSIVGNDSNLLIVFYVQIMPD
ncbi:diguanylate cyclase, partial [Shigella dysenteriae]|uniref:diguanylate cyclase domain-containing protein n=1 Tax=Shigella dysenteriae TaxID=622 RepID=UPI000E5D0459